MVADRSTMKPNREQQRVIDELDRNILLLASAGTGKTGTLAKRITHIIASGRAQADEILCLTFTNKGSREIQNSVSQVVGAEARRIRMGTFHSFCWHILQEEGKHSDQFYEEVIVFDEEECTELLKTLWPAEGKSVVDSAIFSFVGYIKEKRALGHIFTGDEEADYRETLRRLRDGGKEQAMLERFRREAKSIDCFLFDQLLEKMPGILVAYQQLLADNQGVDFTDLIVGVYELFQHPEIRERWRQRYRYICIDEVQDTNALEFEVLKPLWKGNHVLLCGDFFQTIYEWRGSIPTQLVETYLKEFDPVTIVFYDNYRSTQTLFQTGLALLEQVFPQEVARLYTKRPVCVSKEEGALVHVVACESRTKEAEYIYKQIRRLYQEAYEAKQEPPNLCILLRTNRDTKVLSEAFDALNQKYPKEQRLRFLLVEEYRFFRRMEIKDMLAFFKLAMNPQDGVSAKRIIKKFVPRVGARTIERLESEACRRTGLRLTDFLDLRNFQKDPYEDLVQGLADDEIIVFDVESTGVDTTKDEIIQIAAIRMNAKGEPLQIFERFIKPQGSVGESEKVHHFSDAYLAEHGEDAATVLQDFKEFSKGAIIVGHNVQYDVNIFSSELARYGLGSPAFKGVYDTLAIFRRFHPNEKNHKLEYLSERFATKHKPSHNAMDDILATGELLLYGIREDIIPTKEARRVFLQEKGPFAEMASSLSILRRKTYTERPSALLVYIMKHMGLSEYYTNYGLKRLQGLTRPLTVGEKTYQSQQQHENERRMENLRQLYRILQEQEQEELGEQEYQGFSDFGTQEAPDRLTFVFEDHHMIVQSRYMRDVLQRTLQRAALTVGEMDPRLKAKGLIPIVTVHQAKGSEFDYVFLASMEKNKFPSFPAIRDGKLAEEKRLFYVALTRPRKELFISYAERNERNMPTTASEFLAYLPAKYTVKCRI